MISKGVALTLSVYNSAHGPLGGRRRAEDPGVSSDRSFTRANAISPADYASSSGEIRFRVRGERSGGMKTRTALIRFTVES